MLLHIDGFDLYGVDADCSIAYTPSLGSGGYTTPIAGGGRFGGVALATRNAMLSRTISTTPVTIGLWVGFAFRFTDTSTSTTYIEMLRFKSTSGTETALRFSSGAASVGLYRSSTALATAAAGSVFDQGWHWVEVYNLFHATAGAMQVYIDGALVSSVSGVSTRAFAAATGIVSVEFGINTTREGRYDDIYVLDVSGAQNTARLGDCRVQTLVPTSDAGPNAGTPSSGSDHFAVVDDLPLSMADYVTLANTAGTSEVFGASDLTGTPVSIYGVKVAAVASKDDAAASSAQVSVKTGSTTSTGASTVLATSAAEISGIFETDPTTSSAWTPSGVNSALPGFVVTT